MRARVAAMAFLVVLAYGCRTTTPPPAAAPETIRGVASWYGEEFAGRTTANGEIFDPAQLTAAHRTLPFGTVVDVTNRKTKQTVRVRINDRGPYVGGRVIDLSYAAAQKIGLIEPGIGEVDIALVRMGAGEREPPVPFEVTVAEAPAVAPTASSPAARTSADAAPPVEQVPVVVDRVEVQTERAGVVTRTQVGQDGRTLEEVPAGEDAQPSAARFDARRAAAPRATTPTRPRAEARATFFVQVGAFSVEENAKALQERLVAIGQKAWIDRTDLYRVRIGPFPTREQAVAARSALEANGLSAIILSE